MSLQSYMTFLFQRMFYITCCVRVCACMRACVCVSGQSWVYTLCYRIQMSSVYCMILCGQGLLSGSEWWGIKGSDKLGSHRGTTGGEPRTRA